MARRRVDLRLDVEFLARIDVEAEKLGQTRTKFMERALESALGGVEESKPEPLDHSVSAPVRAPVVESDAFAAGEVMDPLGPGAVHRASAKAGKDLLWDRQQRLNKRGKK